MCKGEVPPTPAVPAAATTAFQNLPSYNVSSMKPWRPSILRLVSPDARVDLNKHWEFFEAIMTEDGSYRTPLAYNPEAQAAPDATEK